MTPTAWDFQNQLTAILNAARQIGKSYVDVGSGNLHRQVRGYPNSSHRMAVCCEVMRRMMRGQDVGSGFLLYRQSFTFSVMWLHGEASTAVGSWNRFGIRPELLHSRMLLLQRFFFPVFAFADFLATFLAAGLA